MLLVGVDVGGTFTDGVVYDGNTRRLHYAKAASTPHDPTQAVLNVLESLVPNINDIDRLVHGLTIGTNAILEGKGADVWILTTRGFRDVLEIARSYCVCKPGGSLVVAVMYGSDELQYNAHRVYGKLRWPYLTSNWVQLYREESGRQRVHVFIK